MFKSLTILSILPLISLLPTLAIGKDHLAIVQLFEWPWDSVASECSILNAAGYGYAQVSPPSEHIRGTQWYTDYQPVSYILQGKRGNRQQFINMVTTCNSAGVGILVDAVLNHMSAGSGTGFAGSSYTKYGYPAVPYGNGDFHSCRHDINNYNDENEVWTCELVGLADLATDTAYVQQKEAAYLQDLVNIGVAGFRFDAAKSYNPDNLKAILAMVKVPSGREPLFVTQEVVFGSGQPVTPDMYKENGNVIEFRTASTLLSDFINGISSLLNDIPGQGWLAATSANSFVTNHDTERSSGSAVTSTSANNAYVLAHIYLLAQPYSVPTVFSGYDFSSFDQGAPQDPSSQLTNPVTCYANGWRCEHRWDAISRMVNFYNKARLPTFIPASQFSVGNSQQISFGRGHAGHVLINNQGGNWSGSFQTTLADGSYCDIIHDACTESNRPIIQVSGGYFNANVPAFDAVVLM